MVQHGQIFIRINEHECMSMCKINTVLNMSLSSVVHGCMEMGVIVAAPTVAAMSMSYVVVAVMDYRRSGSTLYRSCNHPVLVQQKFLGILQQLCQSLTVLCEFLRRNIGWNLLRAGSRGAVEGF